MCRTMSIEKLNKQAKKVMGVKQVIKVLERNRALQVFVAADADVNLVEPLKGLCESKGVPLYSVESKKELGRACGIQTGAAAAAELKE